MNNPSSRVGVVIFLLVCSFTQTLHAPHHYHRASDHGKVVEFGEEGQVLPRSGTEFEMMGSSLPDCSHACGACFPCKRVVVSLKCSMDESCPIVYRCMCKGKYYHVPSY